MLDRAASVLETRL